MREILFRAKTASTHEWVEGYYTKADTYGVGGRTPNTPMITNKDGFWVEINPETLGEYTSIKDKNGKKIFEGDIVLADNGHIGYVVFRNGSFVKGCSCHNSVNTFYGDNETVIGNIYDNPELLKEVENNGKIH